MSNSPQLLENFIQMNYPGMNLPPLWQVIYQEAIRGHHLLFRRGDVEAFDMEAKSNEFWTDEAMTEDLEMIVLKLIACSELQAMIRVIDALPEEGRRNLYFMYRRVLWIWRNYLKDQLN